MRVAFALSLSALLAYLSNLSMHVSSDATPHILTAASWLHEGDADLDEFAGQAQFSGRIVGGSFHSWYPPGVPLLAVAPVAVAQAMDIAVTSELFLALTDRLLASALTAASVGLVYLTCVRLVRPAPAMIAAVTYAFGTSTWAVSSQQLSQHGPSQLFVALGAFVLAYGTRTAARAGIANGIATLMRPTDAFVAAAGILAVAREDRVRYVAWGLPALAFLLVYNTLVFGSPLRQSYPEGPWILSAEGYAGLLVSPSRGLLVYSPFLLVAIVGLIMAWRTAGHPARLIRAGSLAIAGIFLVHGSIAFWWGGWTYGNRYLSDALPLFALALAYAIDRGALQSRIASILFAAAVAWSVLLQFAGAGWYYELWNGTHWDVTPNIDATPWRLWDWSDSQWWWMTRRVLADPGERLLPALVGALAAALLVAGAYRAATARAADPTTLPTTEGSVPIVRADASSGGAGPMDPGPSDASTITLVARDR